MRRHQQQQSVIATALLLPSHLLCWRTLNLLLLLVAIPFSPFATIYPTFFNPTIMSTTSCLTTAIIVAALVASTATAFSVVPQKTSRPSSQLHMGLFDGVKDAFSAPALERSTLDADRETPIDRWFGWSVAGEEQATSQAADTDFVDSMDTKNYVTVELEKPMGIVFEENEEEYGGIFVQSLKEDSKAEGILAKGDQLVVVSGTKVSGLSFDDALGAIVDDESPKTKLVLFRGTAKQFYGPTGASKEWLDEFVASS